MADAVTMKPKFVPDAYLLGRDDSGGYEYQPYTAQWGDGGYTTGQKDHLGGGGTGSDAIQEISGDEQMSTSEQRNKNKGPRGGVPASSKSDAKD